MRNRPVVSPCPCCTEGGIERYAMSKHSIDGPGYQRTFYSVTCSVCGHEGRRRGTEEGARISWDLHEKSPS